MLPFSRDNANFWDTYTENFERTWKHDVFSKRKTAGTASTLQWAADSFHVAGGEKNFLKSSTHYSSDSKANLHAYCWSRND